MRSLKGYRTLVLALLLVLACQWAPILAQDHRSHDVVKFIESYDKAWNSKDIKAVDQMLAEKYVYFSSTGATTSRKRTLELLRAPGYLLKSSVRSDVKVFSTGNTAVVGSRWVGTGSFDGEPINDDQRCSLVLTKAGKRWQILSEHCTQITGG